MKKIALFGATGSIGRSTLDVVGTIDGFRVLAISGHKNLPLLREQMERFRPRWVILTDEEAAKEWDFPVPTGTEICVGMKALTEIAAEPEVEIVVSAIVGRAGLESTVAAARAGKRIALANKESLVIGGAIVKRLAKESGAQIVPVDSEHSAIFQALHAGKRSELERVILTASGGPFFRLPDEELRNVTVAQALKTAHFGAALLESLGFEVDPEPLEERHDIIQTVAFGRPEPLLAFCRGIQSGAPVDSYVTPEPWDMPGYDCPIVMAAGAFIQGASIELSCDAPMREPYTAYMQGGLTYESGKLGILKAAQLIISEGR